MIYRKNNFRRLCVLAGLSVGCVLGQSGSAEAVFDGSSIQLIKDMKKTLETWGVTNPMSDSMLQTIDKQNYCLNLMSGTSERDQQLKQLLEEKLQQMEQEVNLIVDEGRRWGWQHELGTLKSTTILVRGLQSYECLKALIDEILEENGFQSEPYQSHEIKEQGEDGPWPSNSRADVCRL